VGAGIEGGGGRLGQHVGQVVEAVTDGIQQGGLQPDNLPQTLECVEEEGVIVDRPRAWGCKPACQGWRSAARGFGDGCGRDIRAQVRRDHDGINRHKPRGSCIEPVPLPGPSGGFASARLPWDVFKLFAQRLIVAEVCELGD
jgi:hypothetical protein